MDTPLDCDAHSLTLSSSMIPVLIPIPARAQLAEEMRRAERT